MENPAQSVPPLLAHTEDLPQRHEEKTYAEKGRPSFILPAEMCFKDCLAKQELNPKVPMHLPPVIPLSVISSLL